MGVSEPSQLLHLAPAQPSSAATDHGRGHGRTGSRSTVKSGPADAATFASPPTTGHDIGSSARRKQADNWENLRRFRRFAGKHTCTVPLLLLLAFAFIYAVNPTESNPVRRFVFLSYRLPQPDPSLPTQYGKGPWDLAFVAFYMVVLSFTREFAMEELLRPLARGHGVVARGKQQRFMEQAYTALYFAFAAPAGVYVMRRTPVWYFNTRGMYEGFPHTTHEAAFKFYYLFQAAYWAQQALVMMMGLEKPRKDFKELVAHHVVTLALVGLSYRFHFTYAGIAVYLTHDVSDLFLALSKSLNYIGSPVIGPFFALSIGMWIYLRHYLNLRILWSVLTEFRTVGPYELDWAAGQYKCWASNVISFGLLAGLQALNLFWLYCLLRSAYRFVVHSVAKDDRSEADESEAEQPAADAKAEELKTPLSATGANSMAGPLANTAASSPLTRRNVAL